MLRRIILLATLCSNCTAQEQLQINEAVWRNLSQRERDIVQSRFVVAPVPMTSFGVIIDNQGTDESTPGTNAGSALGAAGANAGYIDHALKSGNYSAKNQLGMTLLGAALGSALDQPGQSKFHFRYAVKRLDGEISYYDVVQSDTFRHPVGVCVSVPAIQKIPQSVCQDSLDIFRQRYVTGFTAELTDAPKELLQSKPTDQMVECSVTNLPKFKTSLKKCISIGGSSNE